MPVIQADSVTDLINSTLRDLGRMRATDLSTDLRRMPAVTSLLSREKVYYAGSGLQWNLIVDDNGSAEFVGLFYEGSVSRNDVTAKCYEPWSHMKWSYGFDRREIAMNMGNEYQVLDLIKVVRQAGFVSGFKKIETTFWGQLASQTTAGFKPASYWVTANGANAATATTIYAATTPNCTFPYVNGSNMTVSTLSSTTQPRWANWGVDYVNITKDDLLDGLDAMAEKSSFRPVVGSVQVPTYGTGMPDMCYYTGAAVYRGMQKLGQAQNESLGNDLSTYYSTGSNNGSPLMFRGAPIYIVPALEGFSETCNGTTATNHIYQWDWSQFEFAFLNGEYMRETVYDPAPNQPTTNAVFIDSTIQTRCFDRRLFGVAATIS